MLFMCLAKFHYITQTVSDFEMLFFKSNELLLLYEMLDSLSFIL